MNLGDILCNNNMGGLSPLEVAAYIEEGRYMESSSRSLIIKAGKYIALRCVGDYYCDPITGKKVKTTSSNNPCHNVGMAFGIDTSIGCNNCHRIMATKFVDGEVNLIKKRC